MIKESFSLYSLIETRFADPISAISISKKNVIIGTMMGRISSLSLIDKKIILLNELSSENISGIIFDNKENYFYSAIGDEEILKFSNDISNNTNSISKIKKCIKKKIIFFYIFTILMFIFYWYLITCFCAVYQNTQIAFIKDSLLSFLLGNLIPFVIYLFSALFRMISLKTSKFNLEYLYKFGNIIPFF
jgi:hypothetical protein